MRYYREHWAFINLPIGIIAALVAIVAWDGLDATRAILVLQFAMVIFHQFEEYAWPGGEQWIMNRVLQPRDLSVADRFPLNQQSAMVTNVFLYAPFSLFAAIFDWTWLGLVIAFMGFGQIIVHGVVTNIRLKWFYNPGMFTAVFGFGALGVWYIRYVVGHDIVTGWDWFFGALGLPAAMVLIIALPTYTWMARRDSPYPFSRAELERFNARWFLSRLGQRMT